MSDDQSGKRDWRISAVLIAVWIVAMISVVKSGVQIPMSVLALASAFFVILIPAMNDLVRSIDRRFGKTLQGEKKVK